MNRLWLRNPAVTALLVLSAGSMWSCEDRQSGQEACRTNLHILERFAENGSVVSEEQLSEAAEFFKRLAGIEVRVDVQHHISIPVEGTATDIRRLKEWCDQNGHTLIWDEDTGRVELAE